ncbi:MAG: Rrf2 family transcriptional regulator [Planctomycetes bacterium]|nr:Rrf2 family transcriptional regulator [Planctomycetota bacterium]MBI3848308.1 Rrf2 family transcriptional regulator [Planctomycetota bacterium]
MRITRTMDVATRGLMILSSRPGKDPILADEIARVQGIEPAALSRVFRRLVEAGLVKQHKGAKRAYTLGVAPDKITLRMILEAVEGPIDLEIRPTAKSERSSSKNFEIHPAWQEVDKRILEILEQYTLESLTLDAQFHLPPFSPRT